MNAFLRQMAVLGILTTLAEHLLPEGGIRKAGRMVMGLMMMLAILTAFLQVVQLPLPDVSGVAVTQQQAELAALKEPGSYRDAVLNSLRRQVEDTATRLAREAGYTDISVQARVDENGRITAVYLTQGTVAAFAGDTGRTEGDRELVSRLAKALSLSEELIHWGAEGTAQ